MQLKEFTINHDLNELTQHRTTNLPLACYETTIIKNINGHIPLHWHEELQFILVVKGIAIFQVNDIKIEVAQGSGLFINSGTLHMAEEKPGTNCTYICLNVAPSFMLNQELYLSHIMPYINSSNLPFIYIDSHQNWGKEVLHSITVIKSFIDNQSIHFEIDLSIQLATIWKNIILNPFPSKANEMNLIKQQRLKQMLHWIQTNYNQKIELEEIAKAGQLSRSECCRYFKTFLKTTPLNYVINYRIEKSLLLLHQTELNITQIAYEVGFNSTSYFIEKFKKAMDSTPLTYRKSFHT